jgi:hypothetical protein
MSRYFRPSEITSISADYLVELRGLEMRTFPDAFVDLQFADQFGGRKTRGPRSNVGRGSRSST